MDDDHPQLSPEPDPDSVPSPDLPSSASSFIQQPLVNMQYHRHNLPVVQPLQSKQSLYNHQPLQQSHRHHPSPQLSMTSPSESVTLTAPYSRDKMHVPHPHANARQQQSSFASYPMYTAADPDLQRRTEEMIMYTPGPSS